MSKNSLHFLSVDNTLPKVSIVKKVLSVSIDNIRHQGKMVSHKASNKFNIFAKRTDHTYDIIYKEEEKEEEGWGVQREGVVWDFCQSIADIDFLPETL